MTDEREKTSRGSDSRARPTARDVPFTRSAGSDSEPAPRGQRPDQLPRDPTYEAELANVELAVLRDRDRDRARRGDVSTQQGARLARLVPHQPPDSVTPESPGTRASRGALVSAPPIEPPHSSGRAVASGTLLSVGGVDPRGRTEPTLQTPRMFFSQSEGGEVYFKPGKIPAVTVHQTLETETVKLSDSVDPRRAKTLPRIDRSALARFAKSEGAMDSEAPVAVSSPTASAAPSPVPSAAGSSSASGLDATSPPPAWRSVEYEAVSSLGEGVNDGQIHASLSPFRDHAEPSFSLNGAPTRPEPLVARREIEPMPSLPAPDTSAMPTQRDLPLHRIEASRPPPAPRSAPLPASNSSPFNSAPRPALESTGPSSEGPSATTASIAAPEPPNRSVWTNYAAFVLALLLAVTLGMWLTRGAEQRAAPGDAEPSPRSDIARVQPPTALPAPPPQLEAPAPSPTSARRDDASVQLEMRTKLGAARSSPATLSAPAPTSPLAAPAPVTAPPKTPPSKPLRETIF